MTKATISNSHMAFASLSLVWQGTVASVLVPKIRNLSPNNHPNHSPASNISAPRVCTG